MQGRPWSWGRGPGLAIILFLVVTAVGTVGYMAVEGWSAWDAFYMTIISVTTAGYREVHPMSMLGQAWTMFVLVAGVSTLFYTASVVMAEIVEGDFRKGFELRRFNRMLEQLTDHFIICGYGRIGGVIADEFQRQGIPYVVIDRDPERVHAAIALGGMAVEADASREDVLRRVGIDRAVEVKPNSRFVGATIRDANLRQDFGVIVVAIKRAAGHMEFNPEPEAVMAAGDQLVVLGHPDQLKALDAVATR